MAPLGFKGRVARMLLNFLDEHGNYRESLEEAAARAAAAEANSLLARDRRGRKKGRRSRNKNNIGGGDSNNDNDDWEDDEDELPSSPNNNNNNNNYPNGLPEDPYEQIQFYYQTFKSRSSEQLRTSLHNYQRATTSWVHTQLHADEQISHISLLLLLLTTICYTLRKRAKTYGKYARIHSILGKKFQWRQMYLHPNFIQGYIFHQYNTDAQSTLDKLENKASKAEEAALLTLRPYQRTKFERYSKLEKIMDNLVGVLLVVGMVLSGMTFCLSLYNLLRGGGHANGGVDGGDDVTTTDGHIYSMDGPTDSDGYPIHLRSMAEQKYADCIVNAETGGHDPNELCDLNSFFMNEVDEMEGGGGTAATTGWGGVLRSKVQMLLHSIGIPTGLSTYLTSLPSQTLAYLSSLFTLCLFVLSHYIAHKIHMATMSNDPMKHFVAADKTMKADGTVEAKKGETEAQRKKRERMLQMERYKAQMAQLAQEAKAKAQARIARMEGVEAAKREEEEKEKKVVEEQDETVKMYGRQFMMMKAGVPDGAIVNSLLPMGVEEEEAKEIITKLREVKVRREAEARKAEEEEAKKAEEEKKLDAMKEKIAADRLKKMKSGGLPSGPPSMGLPPSLTNAARKGYNRSKSLPAKKSPKKIKPSEKTEAEKAEEAKRTEAMRERIAAREGAEKASGLKVAQPWASPGKKESPSPKNKRWDKVTKSWLDRDLETEDADAVPTSVVLKADEGGEKQGIKVFVPTHKTAEDNAKSLSVQTSKKAAVVDPTALKSSMLSQIRAKSQSPVESKTKTEFKTFVPTHTSPAHRVVSPTAAKDTTKVDEKKYDSTKFNPITPKTDTTNTAKTQETKMSTPVSSQSSSPPPVLLRATESPDVDDAFSPNAFDNPSAWSRRSRADDIKAMIDAVESAPDDQADSILLGPNSLHSPAFGAAMRAPEALWDKRPSSRDIMAKIREAEQQEAKTEEGVFRRSSSKGKATMIRIDEGKNMIDSSSSKEASTDPKIGTSLLRKTKSQGGINSDDDISEISMNDDLTLSSATLAAPIQMRKQMTIMVDGDMKSIPKLDAPEESGVSKTKDQGSEADTGTTAKKSAAKSESTNPTKEETEEEKLRRKKAEDRAKKFEMMNARRRKGKGDDDGTAVSGISRRHRIRRKRSALAAIIPDEQKRDDWKKGVFASVLNVEQERWKTSIYAHVINAEETRATNIKAQKDLEELNAAAKRRIENQKRLDEKAKKFAARAEKFHKLRRTDDGSVVSSSSRLSRRRRTRKHGVDSPPRKCASAAPKTPEAPPQAQMVSPIREEEHQMPDNSVASKQLFTENGNADQPKTEPNNVEEADAAHQPDATDARDALTSTELVKEKGKDISTETDKNDESAVAGSDQYESLNAVAQAVECEDTTNESKKGIDLEGGDEAEKGVGEANAALNSVTIETEAESDKEAPKSQSKIGALKNMKNRRKAIATKKKMRKEGSTN